MGYVFFSYLWDTSSNFSSNLKNNFSPNNALSDAAAAAAVKIKTNTATEASKKGNLFSYIDEILQKSAKNYNYLTSITDSLSVNQQQHLHENHDHSNHKNEIIITKDLPSNHDHQQDFSSTTAANHFSEKYNLQNKIMSDFSNTQNAMDNGFLKTTATNVISSSSEGILDNPMTNYDGTKNTHHLVSNSTITHDEIQPIFNDKHK